MDRRSPGEEPETTRTTTITTASSSSAAAITMATARSSTPAPSTALSIVPSDRQAVQVIQQAIQRPQTMAAQYLHQMYAAQQQHLMLQTAALQQHQRTPHLQSLQATIQQASIIGRRQSPSLPSSSSGSLSQSASVSQNSISLPASPVTAQLIGRTQTSSSTAAGGTISQQAMLLGNGPANCSQAQMYLRTQMLILTPAAPVAAVQTDLPAAVTSCSSLTPSSQVQSVSVRAHLPGALATAQGVLLKPSTQSQALAQPAATLPKMSICPLKASQQPEASPDSGAEVRPTDGARLTSGSQLLAPAAYTPVQSHTLVKQQPACSLGHRGAHHQLIIQQTTGVSPSHRQLQPIAFRVTPDTSPTSLPLSVQRLTSAAANAMQSQQQHGDLSAPSSSSSCVTISVHASSGQTSTSSAAAATTAQPQPQPQPPPLVAAPQRRSTTFQVQSQRPPPPPPLVLPRFPQNPSSSLQRLSLRSIQALAGHMLLTEEELPVAETLVQMPYQHLQPPQTVAVDLKVHPVKRTEAPVVLTQMCKANGLSPDQKKEENHPDPHRDRSPTPRTVSPKENGTAVMEVSCAQSACPAIASPEVEEPPHVSSSNDNDNHSSTSPPPPSPPPLPPPPLLPTAVRGLSQSPPATASLPASPDSVLRPHILTHLIEGFIIREGLEPFPADQQAMLPDSQERRTNGDAGPDDSPLDAEQSDSSDSEMENDTLSVVDEPTQTVSDMLQCEFCGKRGFVHTFLRSKRFCSMTCVRRFNVSCTRRISMLRADRTARWGHRPMGRRGRPPGRVNGASREHFLRQAHGSHGPEDPHIHSLRDGREEGEEDADDGREPPPPMTTRLRRQAEREREKESLEERRSEATQQQHQDQDQDQDQDQEMIETLSASDTEDGEASSPSQWSVEQVFSYINSLPGGQDIAQEFRLQEIDGQALLLLTEDHLVSTMNLKLGPALKICAYINTLRD